MKLFLSLSVLCITALLLNSCFKTNTIVYPRPDFAKLITTARVWHGYEQKQVAYPGYDSSFTLPDTSFALIYVNDSTVRVPGWGVFSTLNAGYYDKYSYNGIILEFYVDSGGYSIQIDYTTSSRKISMTLHEDDGNGDYTDYEYQSP
jgi:hypothetical protein